MGKEKRPAAEGSTLFDAKAQAAMEQKKEKRNAILIGIAVVLAIVLMAGVIGYKKLNDSGYLLRREVAAESENFKVDGAMMAYYFRNNYQQYASMAEQLGINTSASLKDQTSMTGTGTWFDFFMDMTKTNVEQSLALCEAAKAAGVELGDKELEDIDLNIEEMKSAATLYGYASFDQFLTLNYGGGIKEKDLRNAMEIAQLASKYANEYSDALVYTLEECEAYYQENADTFDSIDYLAYTVYASDFEEKNELDEVTNATEAVALAEEKARYIAGAADADDFKARVKEFLIEVKGEDEEHAEEHMAELLYQNAHRTDGFDDAFIEWAFAEDAAAGSVTVMTADDTSYDAYYLVSPVSRDETLPRDVRHILFANEDYESAEEAEAAAEAAYAEWEAAGFSDEKFEELNQAHNADTGSVDNGGLYEDVAPGDMVAEFNDWLFDSARVVGDHALVETESYGWHIMNYVGEGDTPVWQTQAETALSNDAYTAMVEEYSANIVFHDDAIAHIAA